MKNGRWGVVCVVAAASGAAADVFHDYEDLTEGFLGETFAYNGVTYRDANRVSGVFPDGATFGPDDLGSEYIIERADLLYNDFPAYGSPVNAMTFGRSYIDGENLTIGPLASIWMDLDEPGISASLDLAFYENGPWGGIEYRLEALSGGSVVASDSLVISDLGGRDNPTWATLNIDGVEFDQLHVYGWLNGQYTAPRGIMDDLSIRAVPAPATLAILGTLLAGTRRRR